MLGWLFNSTVPLSTLEKVWVERRMCHFAATFGLPRMLGASTIPPNDEFFPDPYDQSDEDARQVFLRICRFMRVDAAAFQFEVFDDPESLPQVEVLDRDGQKILRIARDHLADRERMIATIARHLAHDMLGGSLCLDGIANDIALVVDLLPVYLGLGVFVANATAPLYYDMPQYYAGSNPTWLSNRDGLLPSRMLGYALALVAYLQNEHSPPCTKYLRLDAATAFKTSLRYLQRTDDTVFKTHNPLIAGKTLSVQQLLKWLSHESSTFRMAALWEIDEHPLDQPAVVLRVRQLMADDDDDV